MRTQSTLIQIQPLEEEHYASILTITEGLPEWFDETARSKSILTDIRHQEGFVAVSEQRVVGFMTLYVAEGRLHIGWLGVDKAFQRQGIGSRLIAAAEMRARDIGIDELATYMLGDSVEYQPYEETRRFYWKCGFSVYKRAQTDNPGCPEEIWISKAIK